MVVRAGVLEPSRRLLEGFLAVVSMATTAFWQQPMAIGVSVDVASRA
ncbi:hypothetical protein [Streptomyces sp. NPDC059460]